MHGGQLHFISNGDRLLFTVGLVPKRYWLGGRNFLIENGGANALQYNSRLGNMIF